MFATDPNSTAFANYYPFCNYSLFVRCTEEYSRSSLKSPLSPSLLFSPVKSATLARQADFPCYPLPSRPVPFRRRCRRLWVCMSCWLLVLEMCGETTGQGSSFQLLTLLVKKIREKKKLCRLFMPSTLTLPSNQQPISVRRQS